MAYREAQRGAPSIVSRSEPPPIIQALPEPHLRGLRDRFGLDGLVSSESRLAEYVSLLHDAEVLLEAFYGYPPTAMQLRKVLAATICDRHDFLTHLSKNGGSAVLDDEGRLAQVASAASGAIVAVYLVERRYD